MLPEKVRISGSVLKFLSNYPNFLNKFNWRLNNDATLTSQNRGKIFSIEAEKVLRLKSRSAFANSILPEYLPQNYCFSQILEPLRLNNTFTLAEEPIHGNLVLDYADYFQANLNELKPIAFFPFELSYFFSPDRLSNFT
jgi:hypothetical protein